MTPGGPLPSLKTVERALRETTERLAYECASPTMTAPAWDEGHWCIAQAVATMQGVSPLLSQRLWWRGPRAWRQFLNQQWQHAERRHNGIMALVARIDAQAREAGIAVMALKGVALHNLGIYTPGTRPMADVDLLVREADAEPACALLQRLGYVETRRERRERTFEPIRVNAPAPTQFGESATSPVKIELHTRIAESLPVRECSITAMLLPKQLDAGLHHYQSASALMMHLLLHAAGNIRTRSLRLIQLNDIAALSSRLSIEDWQHTLRPERAAEAWWAFPTLTLTARYFPAAIPSAVLARSARACPAVLRHISLRQRLSDVSFSHLWIEFCPGIEWCSSPMQVLRYMRARAFPSSETRAEAKTSENTEAWASNSSWSKMSRPRRVLRWLVSRPPRVATMWSVRAAWEKGGTTAAQACGTGS